MRSLLQIGDINDGCNGLVGVVRIIRKGFIPIVQIGIPILLIIYGVIDLGKAVLAGEEKEQKAATSRLIKRVIYAILIFLLVTLVTVVMGLVSKANDPDVTGTDDWKSCWIAAGR